MGEVGEDSFHFDTTGDVSVRTDVNKASKKASGSVLSSPQKEVTAKEVDGLLLPSNVQFDKQGEDDANGRGKQEETLEIGEEERRLGHFVTLDRGSGQSRYWEAEEEEERRAHEICITCGEKGHDKRSCTHELCLACGALDVHSTRECAQGLTCFRCGERGHRLSECTQRRKPGGRRWVQECAQCGSQNHLEANCPSHWRLYYYSEPDVVDAFRKAKWLELGRDSVPKRKNHRTFDYRSSDEEEINQKASKGDADDAKPPAEWDPAERWCYNCAARGSHWGDDCPERRCNLSKPTGEPSAYSEHLSRSGPYAQTYAPPPAKASRPKQGSIRGDDLSARIGNFKAGANASMHIVDLAESVEPRSRHFNRQAQKENTMLHQKIRREHRGDDKRSRSHEDIRAEKKRRRKDHHVEKAERRKKEYGKRT